MPVSRKLIAHDNNQDAQWLKIDHSSRYIENHSEEWQFLFNLDSSLNTSTQVLKLGAEFNTQTLDKIRVVAYLYNPITGNVDNASSCTFKIYKVEDLVSPRWNDNLAYTVSGIQQPNQYFFQEIDLTSIPSVSLDGENTILLEASVTRLNVTYRDRLYINHLGVYSSIIKLRQDVDFLDITKLDE
jgi:hypothetical protein